MKHDKRWSMGRPTMPVGERGGAMEEVVVVIKVTRVVSLKEEAKRRVQQGYSTVVASPATSRGCVLHEKRSAPIAERGDTWR